MAVKGQKSGLDRTQNGTTGKSSGSAGGAATNALLGGTNQTQTQTFDRDRLAPDHPWGNLSNPPGGKTSGAGDDAPTFTHVGTGALAPNAPQYDATGRLLSDGSIPSVPNASLGQKIGLFAGLLPGGAGLLNSAPDWGDRLDGSDETGGAGTGGALGRAIDALTGERPGGVIGTVANRVAPNSQTRGERPADDTRLADRSFQSALSMATGGMMGDPAAEFSGVTLADKRKPRSLDSALQVLGLA